MNKVILMGRMVRDPEVRYTQSGKTVCQFTVAVERYSNNSNGEKECDFIQVIAFNKQAEVIGNNFSKGQRILVDGRLQIRNYEAKDGSKRIVAEVLLSGFEFIEKKEKGEEKSMTPFGVEMPFDENMPF